jgi:acetyltransferase
VRPVEPEDRALLLDAFERRFGAESRYGRFMAPKKRLSPTELDYFTDVDHDLHEAIGAIDPRSGEGIGIARFIRDRAGAPSAEAAVALADEWQGQGLGWLLLDRLADRARAVGVHEFSASLLAGNRAMLALFARLGRMEVRHDSGSAIRLVVDLTERRRAT